MGEVEGKMGDFLWPKTSTSFLRCPSIVESVSLFIHLSVYPYIHPSIKICVLDYAFITIINRLNTLQRFMAKTNIHILFISVAWGFASVFLLHLNWPVPMVSPVNRLLRASRRFSLSFLSSFCDKKKKC